MKEDDYTISEIYNDMAEEIILEKRPDILNSGVSVGFVSSMKQKKKGKTHLVLGECRKVQPIEKLFCPYDFLIIIYEPNCEALSEDQMKILIWHELNHIGIDENGEHYIVPHDIEEFFDIIKEHGMRWAGGIDNGSS